MPVSCFLYPERGVTHRSIHGTPDQSIPSRCIPLSKQPFLNGCDFWANHQRQTFGWRSKLAYGVRHAWNACGRVQGFLRRGVSTQACPRVSDDLPIMLHNPRGPISRCTPSNSPSSFNPQSGEHLARISWSRKTPSASLASEYLRRSELRILLTSVLWTGALTQCRRL